MKFEIDNYVARLFNGKRRTGIDSEFYDAYGWIGLYGKNEEKAFVYFLTDEDNIPDAFVVNINDNARLTMFLPKSAWSDWIDLLRNEKPLWCSLYPDRPSYSYITTKLEPVGEGE